MKINKKLIITVLSLCSIVTALVGTSLSASAESATSSEVQLYGLGDRLETYSISAPTCEVDTTSYNIAVAFNWYVGSGGNQVAISNDWVRYENKGATHYHEFAFPDKLNSKWCTPYYLVGKSYNSSSNYYSKEFHSIEWKEILEDGLERVRYDYPATYAAIGGIQYGTSASMSATIPTKYDLEGYVWHHRGATGNIIKGTIYYDGVIRDMDLVVPFIGYKSTSVIISGVTFTLRTGPNRCSIIANQEGISRTNVKFAFGMQH